MRNVQPSIATYLLILLILIAVVGCSQDDDNSIPTQTIAAPADVTAPVAEQTNDPQDGTAAPQATADTAPLPSPTPGPTATATRVPTGSLTVCMAQEPASLYLYGPDSYAARVVRELVYDGPIDTREFGFQAVILEKIPSVADGDARLETVSVSEGDLVVDTSGNVVRLRDGVTVRPSGCLSDDCAVTFAGTGESEEQESEDANNGAEQSDEPQAATLEMEQLVVEFALLEGLTWSDGEPLTAADSVFSFEKAQTAEIPPRQRTGQQGVVPARRVDPVERTASYEALDETTVRWTGLPGFMDSYYQGNFFVPLPAHQLGALSEQELQEAEISARLPMGWGPYVLEAWNPGEQIRAIRNPNYFRNSEGLPYFDEVIFQFTNDYALPDALESGNCDLVTNDALAMDWQSYTDWDAQGVARFYQTPGTIWEHVVFGINPSSQVTWRGDLFEDVRVRQAAAYCINREAIMNELMGGLSAVPNTFVPPEHPLYPAAQLNDYAYDPQAGLALLQEGGWRDTNGDGILESYGVEGLSDGSTLVFSYVTTASELRERIGQRVAEDLSQCGMRVSVTTEPVPPQIFFTPDISSPIFGRAFDITGFAWFADMLPPCHLYLSSETPSATTGWSGFNVGGFSNEAYDRACRTALSTVPGMEAYATNHAEAMRLFNEQLPAIPLFVHVKSTLARPNIEGLQPDPSQTAEIWNLESLRRAEE